METTDEIEIWRDIPGFDTYQASSFGRVRSFRKNINGHILTPCFDAYGYFIVNLWNGEKWRTKPVHQLIAYSFLNHKPCGYKLVVNHKDYNKTNNHLSNLELVTQRENSNQKNKKHLTASRYTGVSSNRPCKTWKAAIYVNGKSKYLGHFKTEIEAHFAYQRELLKINQ